MVGPFIRLITRNFSTPFKHLRLFYRVRGGKIHLQQMRVLDHFGSGLAPTNFHS